MTLSIPEFQRLLSTKAASGPGVYALSNDRPLLSMATSDQERMKAYLKAYKVGWFYKAESKISSDVASMKRVVAHEDEAGDNEATVIEPDLFTPWEQLDPIGQFLRLMERPNPYQTGRQLFQKTQIRIDMAGSAFWYMEGVGSLTIPPTGLYGISPSRMWPSVDRQSGQLLGWVMDRDAPSGGVPFEASEILHFTTGTSDDSPFGTGVVEAVHGELPITEMMARHVSDVLQTGGRLAGMLWPKDRVLDESEFQDAQKAWRNVASDPNAARRMLIFPEPMEYSQGASTPAEIGIPELANLNRDNILTAFPISPYQLGVPMPGGLNSAETRREDRRDYNEGTLHNRVELLEETIQIGLMARYEKLLGTTYDFDIEEPNLDDASTLLEKAGAMRALVSLGFDDKEAVQAVGLDHIKFNGTPPPPAVPDPNPIGITVNDTNRRDRTATTQALGKASKAAEVERRRDDALDPINTRAKDRLVQFFADQRRRVEGAIRDLPTGKSARSEAMKRGPDWWDRELEDQRLRETMRGIYLQVGRSGLQSVADSLGRMMFPEATTPIVNDLLSYGGSRIKDINDRTLMSVVTELAEGTRRGYSIPQLIDGVPTEGFKGISGITLDNGVAVFGDARAETIARTETMLSYNRATVKGYGEFGVTYLLAYDGDHDEPCAARNGQEYPIDEALGMDDHPNGTLVWSPVVNKADTPELTDVVAAIKSLPVPIVNVAIQNPGPLVRTVLEFDELGDVIGSHPEPLDG